METVWEGMSPSEVAARKMQLHEIQNVYRDVMAMETSEQDRISHVVKRVLPLFCRTFAECEALSNYEVGESIGDIRGFTILLTKAFIDSVRSIPESRDKQGASSAILSVFSTDNMLQIMSSIAILCRGPEIVVGIINHQKIPSIVFKLFRSLIDLPVAAYSYNDSVVLDEQAEIHSGGNLERTRAGIVSLCQAFVTCPGILERLLIEDAMMQLIKILVSLPAMSQDQSTHHAQAPGIYHLTWKEAAINVLISVPNESEFHHYIHKKSVMGTLVKYLTASLETCAESNDPDAYEVIHKETLFFCRWVKALYMQSQSAHLYTMVEDFKSASGYEFLHVLLASHSTDACMDSKFAITDVVEALCYIGPNDDIPILADDAPYQYSDFQLPPIDYGKDTLIRNEAAFKCLVATTLWPDSNEYTLSDIDTPLSGLKANVLEHIDHIMRRDKVNYFLAERSNFLPLCLEKFDTFE
ncbi:hypothetical protein BZG36_05436, partial [Bifiguratus adelaidae]